jgi:hypothetical protein
MKTVDIKGKEYVMVNERLKFFRENYPDHCLVSEIISMEDGVITIKASVLDANNRVIAIGHAQEKETNGFINKFSYVENCETSAWGRALANFGIGIDTSVASFDEVANAIKNQNKPEETIRDLKKEWAECKKLADASKLWESLNESEKKAYKKIKEETKLRIRKADIEKEIGKLTAKNYQQNFMNIYEVIDATKGEEKQKLINIYNDKLIEIGVDEPYEPRIFEATE